MSGAQDKSVDDKIGRRGSQGLTAKDSGFQSKEFKIYTEINEKSLKALSR